MALFDSNTRSGSSIGGYMPGYFGGTPIGGSKGESNAKMLSPNLKDAYQGFQKLQPGLMSNQLQQDAVGEQQGLRGRLSNLLDQQGQGERMRIDDAFQTAANNATGGLASRGFAGSSLNIPAQLGVERERNMAHAQLNDSLLGRRMGMESDVSKNISDLLFGSSEQATNLQAALLGAQGIGNFAESESQTAPKSGGSTGGGAGPGEVGSEAYDRFKDWSSQFSQPGGPDSRSSGGPGGSPGGGPGGSPSAIRNPYAGAPPKWSDGMSEGKWSSYQENFPEGDPLNPEDEKDGPIRLQGNQGPLTDREAFEKDMARLDRAQAEGRTAIVGGGDLAGGPGDALGGGLNSGMQPGMGMA